MVSRIYPIIILCCIAAGQLCAEPSGPENSRQDVQLSPELLELLRAEMREISAGMQTIALSMATADWPSIHETSNKISSSYILKQKITAAQIEELERALPEQFKRLDGEFHQRAEKLAAAAAKRDLEIAAFQYSRMMENCTDCHSAFAKSRFPGFSSEPSKHEHH
jgi:cytochrome c556